MFENGHNMIPLAAILSIGEKVLGQSLYLTQKPKPKRYLN
jgi:hypothetical protein